MKLPFQVTQDGKVVPTDLSGDPAGFALDILNGVHLSDNRIEISVNFYGTFILAVE